VDEYAEVVKFTSGNSALNDQQLTQLRDQVWNTYVNNKLIEHEAEETMHSRISNCYNNWSTPSSTLQLLEKLYNEPILNETHTEFLKNILIETSTGKDKIKAGLPDNIALGHKTGSSDRLDDGTKIGDNDTGVIYLPNGKLCFLAIFIKDSRESDQTNAQIIADIARIIYNSAVQK
jgi:beta-lactamase class A